MMVLPNYRILSAVMIVGLSGGLHHAFHAPSAPIHVPIVVRTKPTVHKKTHPRPVLPVPAVVPVVVAQISPEPEAGYSLQSGALEKDYDLLFTGQVDCGKNICRDIPLKLAVSSVENPTIEKSGRTDAEGRYTFKIALRDIPNESLDWSLRVASGYGQGETVGRQILEEDTTAVIEPQLALIR